LHLVPPSAVEPLHTGGDYRNIFISTVFFPDDTLQADAALTPLIESAVGERDQQVRRVSYCVWCYFLKCGSCLKDATVHLDFLKHLQSIIPDSSAFDESGQPTTEQMAAEVAVVHSNDQEATCRFLLAYIYFIFLNKFATDRYNPGPDDPVLFGIRNIHNIPPLDPYKADPPYPFYWEPNEMSAAPISSPEVLVPPPSIDPPAGSGFVYPAAPSYSLVPDKRYRRGYVYATDFDTSKRRQTMDNLLRTITPPGVGPVLVDGKLESTPVPGMILMPPSVPFVNRIDGSNERIITVACVQTIESMQQYACGPEVRRLADIVLELGFGKPATKDHPAIPAVYELGLKHNDRSTKDISDPHNGSSSLATTKIEGDGRGTIAPAVQVQHPQIRELLQTCYHLFRHIMPTCISKFEWDMIEWLCRDNNVPGFGGPLPNNTGLQGNVSSDIAELAAMIGQFQGRLHADRNDYHPFFTLFILALRLPPGEGCPDNCMICADSLVHFCRKRYWAFLFPKAWVVLQSHRCCCILCCVQRQRHPW
jgi:hypothetical protein